MLPSMVRSLVDAWDESGRAIGEAGDALDLESRSVAPFTRLSLDGVGRRAVGPRRRDLQIARPCAEGDGPGSEAAAGDRRDG